MSLVSSSGFAHVRLTVTDIAASKAFYDRVFGWPIAVDASARVDEPGVRESPEAFYGGVVYQSPAGALLGLRPVSNDRFESTRTGLDHASFLVESRAALVDAHHALDEAGIEHGDVTDLTDAGLAILSFSDPDGVHLELCALLT